MMRFSSLVRAGVLLAVLATAACKNSGGPPFVPPLPPTDPPGSTLPPDAGGGTGNTGDLAGTLIDCVTPFFDAITPFRNPLELFQFDPDSSGEGDFPGLAAMATAQFGEVGTVLLVMYNDGVFVYDSIGRPLARPLTFDANCNLIQAAFLWPPGVADDSAPLDIIDKITGNSSETYLVSYMSGAIGVWEFERGYVGGARYGEGPPDDYFFHCDVQDADGTPTGPRDFWINGDDATYCSSTAERMCGATNASLQLNNLPGGPANLGLEYDAYGNLWHRSFGLGIWADLESDQIGCEAPGDENADSGGRATVLPLLVMWERGLERDQMDPNMPCPFEVEIGPFPGGEGGPDPDGFGYFPGQCNVHVFHSINNAPSGGWGIATNFSHSAVSDFDFTSDNRMVFADGEAHRVGWTGPFADHFDIHPFGNVTTVYTPPAPPQVAFWTGDFGANTGPINTHFNTPWGVAVDRGNRDCDNGNRDCVYITDFGNARITIFDDAGNYERTIGPSVSPQLNFMGPIDVFFDDFCRIFVLDRVIRPDLSLSSDLKVMFRDNCPVPTPGSATITVRNGDTGAPIEGARVVLGLFAGEIVGITDNQGKVDFPTIPPGQRFVTVNADRMVSATLEFFVGSGETITIEDAPASGSVRLFPVGDAQLGGVTGKVRDASSGLVIPGAVVLVRGTGQLDVTSLSGLFAITGVVAGTHTLDASADGYFPASKGASVVAGLSVDVGDILLTPIPPT